MVIVTSILLVFSDYAALTEVSLRAVLLREMNNESVLHPPYFLRHVTFLPMVATRVHYIGDEKTRGIQPLITVEG